ncbi:hypothetical protein GDO86_008234 [Hymenochirus boettgeri]|uniref:Uncharacterized protein n=1 Tax=Hymenochirus boettgeri TaxID=247094 RepID=A0A8T2J2A2_9PIPI|nr:hypothetical protein GDO86_008234 [Hymenochirus boettgeri]
MAPISVVWVSCMAAIRICCPPSRVCSGSVFGCSAGAAWSPFALFCVLVICADPGSKMAVDVACVGSRANLQFFGCRQFSFVALSMVLSLSS